MLSRELRAPGGLLHFVLLLAPGSAMSLFRIGLTVRFDLSSGDPASIADVLDVLDVQPVSELGVATMLSPGLVGLGLRPGGA